MNDKLSNLSSIPPCPGIIFEKSFMSFSLFILLKNRSPICPRIDNINVNGNSVTYNGITIEKEHLRENIGEELYSYARWNGVKYYFLEESERIISFINGIPVEKEKDSQYVFLKNLILSYFSKA